MHELGNAAWLKRAETLAGCRAPDRIEELRRAAHALTLAFRKRMRHINECSRVGISGLRDGRALHCSIHIVQARRWNVCCHGIGQLCQLSALHQWQRIQGFLLKRLTADLIFGAEFGPLSEERS